MRTLYVFPRRTSMTPEGPIAIGEPDLFAYPKYDAIHVSCVFTWDLTRCRDLQHAWRSRFPDTPVLLGGPALDDPGGPFVPGRYVRKGVSISSRGCPNSCPWCFVPKREGKQRLLDICPGNDIQDNNVTTFPRDHFLNLCKMLKTQRRIRFLGGLEARRFMNWHVDALGGISRRRFREFWFAADHDDSVRWLRWARDKLHPFLEGYADGGRKKLRCYVMIGYAESIHAAQRRLENVWDAGFLPFAQLYRDNEGGPEYDRDWYALQRKWARPAAMCATAGK